MFNQSQWPRIISGMFSIAVFVAIILLSLIMAFPSVSRLSLFSKPNTWVTIEAFHGNGDAMTHAFAVPEHWRIAWSCDPSSSPIRSYNVIVTIKYPLGIVDFGAVNTFCRDTNRGGIKDEYQDGVVYLDVISEGAWTIEVRVLQ